MGKKIEALEKRIDALEKANIIRIGIDGGYYRNSEDCVVALNDCVNRMRTSITMLATAMGYELFSEPPKNGYRKIKKDAK